MKDSDDPRRMLGQFSEIEIVASDWLMRHETPLTGEEQREFAAWLDADVSHRETYIRMQRSWTLLDALPQAYPDGVPARLPTSTWKRSGRRWIRQAALAAAAVIAMSAIFAWRERDRARNSPVDFQTSTAVGEMRNLALPDGSTIQLNTDSAVRVQYTATERRLHLARGEAHFTVAKNPARPFFVEAGKVAVRAVGTAFNVRLRSHAVDILVTEGKVRVGQFTEGYVIAAEPIAPTGGIPLVSAGQRVSVGVGHGTSQDTAEIISVAADEIEHALAWQARRLKFRAEPLSEVVAEFNRYNKHQLVIDDAVLAAQRFGGTFRPDRYQALVDMLEATFGVSVERRANETVLRRKRE